MIHEPLTKLQCSPTSDGSAAARRRVRALRRRARPLGPGDRDRRPGDGHRHDEHVRRGLLHQDRRLRHVARRPRDRAYEEARRRARRRRRRSSCTTASRANELITYEALGLAEEGKGHELVDAEDTTYGGKWVVNPSRRADLEGPPARRDRPGAVLGAHLAAARPGRQAPGRRRQGRAPAQHRPRRRRRRQRLQARRVAATSAN